MQYREVIDKMISHLEKVEFRGYDPYDALNMGVPWERTGKILPVFFIQLFKRVPVNLRPLVGIKKGYNPKAMGLFLHAFSILYRKTGEEKYRRKADFFFNWLYENTSGMFEGKGWGYNFRWISPIRHLPSSFPSAVVTAFNCRAVFEYLSLSSDPRCRELIGDCAEFIEKSLPLFEDETGISISYTPLQQEVCYNASLLAAEVLAYQHFFKPSLELANKIKKAVAFVITRQKDNGSWAYSEDPQTGSERYQLDFHQGFILESLYIINSIFPNAHLCEETIISKGLEFYRKHQFDENGRAFYRLPKKYP